MPALVLCAHRDPGTAGKLRDAITAATHGGADFEHFSTATALLNRATAAAASHHEPALIFCGPVDDDGGATGLLHLLHQQPALRASRKILIATRQEAAGASELLRLGAVHGLLDPDFSETDLHQLLRHLLTDFVLHSAPHLIDELHPILDLREFAAAFTSARARLTKLNERIGQVERSVIGADLMTDDQVESAMISEFDRLLENPERSSYEPGEILVREGEDPGCIWIILSGQVKLFRSIEGEDLTFHSESAGRIVGLMSLSLQNPIFFSCRAVNAVTALRLSRAQITDAIHRSPVLSNYLITVILRSMARRNRRAAQLLTQVRTLNKRLSSQRDELSAALDELRETQRQLIESAKMATLGNLAAGMAHELNNPVAAILSASGHLAEDLATLLATSPDFTIAHHLLTRPAPAALATREERQLRDELAATLAITSPRAARLIAAGIHDASAFREISQLAPAATRDAIIDQIDRAGQIAAALRNIQNCGTRIAALVRSLKTHARQDDVPRETTDVHATLEDVLLILTNKLKSITVLKEYGTLPHIQAHPGQLQQVWTNLITNAIQAMDESGTLAIRTTMANPDTLRVEIEDHGKGIPPEVAERLFETRFTTRSGRVEFGLGLGLPISQNIIHQHGGQIRFTSRPGLTCFTVDLPATA
jgi:signal transduction histidine kinase